MEVSAGVESALTQHCQQSVSAPHATCCISADASILRCTRRDLKFLAASAYLDKTLNQHAQARNHNCTAVHGHCRSLIQHSRWSRRVFSSTFNLLSLSHLPDALLESLITEEFRSFMATYGRSYDSVEEMLHRARVFATNVAHINAINANPANTWKAAVNKLADQTTEEISRLKVSYLVLECLLCGCVLDCVAGLPPRHVPLSSLSPRPSPRGRQCVCSSRFC